MQFRVVGLSKTLGRTYWTGKNWSTTQMDGKKFTKGYAQTLARKMNRFSISVQNYGIEPADD